VSAHDASAEDWCLEPSQSIDTRSGKFFSVVIPTRNRPERLAECLQSIGRLHYPADRFEVIVVDDGSETETEKAVALFRQRLDVTLLRQSHGGPAKARNTGVKQAKGEFLAFTDDDCTPASDWLQTLSRCFTESPDCLVGGRTINGLPDNPYSTTSQVLIDYLYAYHDSVSDRAAFFTSNNLAIRMDQFRRLGGFDGTFSGAAAEDREFCDRCRREGIRVVYAREAVVYHKHSLTLRTFWRQHFNYGRGACHFQSIRASRGLKPIRVEPLKFYWSMISYPFAQEVETKPWFIAGLLALTQAATAVGFYWEKLSDHAG
jgi:GT2 family glycosyltransferase